MTRAEYLTGETGTTWQAWGLAWLLSRGDQEDWVRGYLGRKHGHPPITDNANYLDGYDAYPHYQMIQDGNSWRHE